MEGCEQIAGIPELSEGVGHTSSQLQSPYSSGEESS